MNYEVDVIREALQRSHIRSLINTDPDDWDRWEAEFIVNFFRTHGWKLAAINDTSTDDTE